GLGSALFALAAAAAVSAPILRVLGSLGPVSVAAASLFMILASIPMGMILPLLVARASGDGLRAAGLLYACNTLGAALAVLLTGFVLLPSFGNQRTLWAASALLALLGAALRRGPAPMAGTAVTPELPLPRAAKLILVVYGV